VVVDRVQGGGELLESLGVRHHALAGIDRSLFDAALGASLINGAQYDMVLAYIQDPTEAMRTFCLTHPTFIANALAGDRRTAERAALCLDRDFYGIAHLYP